MQISVLILTHNRPQLFERCIKSVIKANEYFPVDLEIIVNNDSNDIEEIYQSITSYHYKQSFYLGEIYKHLFDQASKEYVYFLEDDDIMLESFFENIASINADIIYGNYQPLLWDSSFIKFTNIKSITSKAEFLTNYNPHNFQFSQLVFKKHALKDQDFPTDNYLQNDFKIFQMLQGTFSITEKFFYKQTRDGFDAISSIYNKDPRWII